MTLPSTTHRLPPASGGTAKRLLVFLHGVGSDGADLIPLARMWREALPDAAMALPDGPEAFDLAPAGRQWFSVDGVTAANRGARVGDAAAAFDRILAAERQWAGVGMEGLILVGFSQGSIMALDAVATGRWRPAAVVAYAGRLSRPPVEPAGPTRLLLVHGNADQTIPAWESETAAAALRTAGYPVELRIEPGIGHTISQPGAQAGAAFLHAAPAS